MKAKQKIGFIFSNYDKRDYTGQPAIAIELMKRLKKEFNLYLVSNSAQIKQVKKKKKELLLPGPADLKTYLFGFSKIVNFLKKNKIELVCVQGLMIIPFVYIIARLLRIRFLTYICETPERLDWFHKKLFLLSLGRAEKIVVSSAYLLYSFQKLGVSKERLAIARIGLNEGFQNLNDRSSKKKKQILFFGDANKDKGFDRVIKIAERMDEVGFRLLVRWLNSDCKNVYRKAKRLKNITIEKYPDYTKSLFEHISESSLILLPIRYMLVRPPLSLVEVAASGKCVMVSNMPSIEEIITHNKTGLICDFDKTNDAVRKIRGLLAHSSKIKRLGRNARKRVKELYSEDEYKKIILSFRMIFDKFYEWAMFSDSGGEYISTKEKRALIRLLAPKDRDKILDVGTGSGRFAREIIKTADTMVYGIDLDKKMLEEGKILNEIILSKDEQKHYKSFLMNGQNLKFKDNSFDKVFSFRVLKYYNNPYRGIDEIIRVQKKGGIFILELTNNKSWESLANPIFKILTKKPKSESFWTKNMKLINVAQAERYLKKKGVKILKSVPLHKLPPRLFRLTKSSLAIRFFDLVDRFLLLTTPKTLFSKSILLKCQK